MSRDSLTVSPSDAGKALGRFLGKHRQDLSFRDMQTLARQGKIRLNGQKTEVAAVLKPGDRIELPAAEAMPSNPKIRLKCAWLDDRLAVVDKPANMAVLPGPGHWRQAMMCGAVAEWPELVALGEARSFGLLHRLDRDTSGLVGIARDRATYEFLTQAFKDRRVEKLYWALVIGHTPDAGSIDRPLAERRRADRSVPGPDRGFSKKTGTQRGSHLLAVVSPQGKPARTHYRCLERRAGLSLIEVSLETGRFHQIRAHMATIQFPLAGDPLYGRTGENQRLAAPSQGGLSRIFLHAQSLSLPRPEGGTWQAKSNLPEELRSVLRHWGFRHGDA